MGDNNPNGMAGDTLESLEAEREDFEKTIACARQVARDFDKLTEQRKSMDPRRIAFHLQLKGPILRRCAWKGIITPEAFQWHKEVVASQKVLGGQVLRDAAAFGQALISWEEDLERRELQQRATLSFSPSIPIVTGGNGLTPDRSDVPIKSVGAHKSCRQDNSGGNPGVLIYTNNWDTYNRYTGSQKGIGQLPGANVTYVGPDSIDNLYLATNVPGAIEPPTYKGVAFAYRVTINQGESWYYYAAQDAKIKAEEKAFIGISSLTPLMVGFSPTAGAGGDLADAVSAATERSVPPVDAGIPWPAGIRARGMAWEDHLAGQMPAGSRLPPNFETFDYFDRDAGTATSAKTLETLTRARVVKPVELYKSLVKNIDAVANFSSAASRDFQLNENQINSRVIEVAIPWTTTPNQMEQINSAVRYGKKLGVIVIITKTK